jgi:predicted amidohydrolase
LGLPLKDQFFGLVRVPEYIWNQIDFHLVPNAFDLNIEPIQRRRRGVCVGCAPLVDSYDEMLIEKSARGRFSRAGYRLAPRDDAVIPRIATVLDRLDAAGAVIGVMPEATLSAAVREHWVEALRLQSAASGSLEWVLVGTGPDGLSDPPPNRAYLLHRTGAVILRQDKMRDFTLTADQIERWRLTDALGKRRKRVEDITPGTRLQLAESNLGRVAIAICEDLARPEIGELIRRSGVSLVLVPIFSGEVNASWAFYASERVMQDTGASLVIATSLAVPKAMSPTASTWSTCGAGGPREDRDEWDYVFEDGSTTDPDEVTTLTIAGALVRRYFDFS